MEAVWPQTVANIHVSNIVIHTLVHLSKFRVVTDLDPERMQHN
jgi:hypothetical protein